MCSDRVLNEIFDEEKMILLYRFSLEIQKAKNSLDLNLGTTVETDDHIVPSVGNGQIALQVDQIRSVINTYGDAAVGRGHVPYFTAPQVGMNLFAFSFFIYITRFPC